MRFPTQSEAEARLQTLRRQREDIERSIADCLAFLELGRRLAAVGPQVAHRDGEADDRSVAVASSLPRTSPREQGRAIVAACLAALREAGRPMHAAEILRRLRADGIEVPGIDPVASLNTRLWKRSGAGRPFRRLGDALYDLARPDSGRTDDEARTP